MGDMTRSEQRVLAQLTEQQAISSRVREDFARMKAETENYQTALAHTNRQLEHKEMLVSQLQDELLVAQKQHRTALDQVGMVSYSSFLHEMEYLV